MNDYLNENSEVNNFTLNEYRFLLNKTKSKYPLKGFEVLDNYSLEKKFALIRHDIDMSIDKALELAKIESDLGIRATYTILMTDIFYNPLEQNNRDTLIHISNLGHDMGLHF